MLSLLTVADHEGRTCKIVTQYLIAASKQGLPAKVLLNSDNTDAVRVWPVGLRYIQSRWVQQFNVQRDTCANTTGPLQAALTLHQHQASSGRVQADDVAMECKARRAKRAE
jgi:hypothetical protein